MQQSILDLRVRHPAWGPKKLLYTLERQAPNEKWPARSTIGLLLKRAGLSNPLSRLSIWWIKLGIVPERIEPGEPQQNGRPERMHRTLKRETARPPAQSVAAQQARFAAFRTLYNRERPQEALQGDTPDERYCRSAREYLEQVRSPESAAGLQVRRVDQDGKVRWKQARLRLGQPLRTNTLP